MTTRPALRAVTVSAVVSDAPTVRHQSRRRRHHRHHRVLLLVDTPLLRPQRRCRAPSDPAERPSKRSSSRKGREEKKKKKRSSPGKSRRQSVAAAAPPPIVYPGEMDGKSTKALHKIRPPTRQATKSMFTEPNLWILSTGQFHVLLLGHEIDHLYLYTPSDGKIGCVSQQWYPGANHCRAAPGEQHSHPPFSERQRFDFVVILNAKAYFVARGDFDRFSRVAAARVKGQVSVYAAFMVWFFRLFCEPHGLAVESLHPLFSGRDGDYGTWTHLRRVHLHNGFNATGNSLLGVGRIRAMSAVSLVLPAADHPTITAWLSAAERIGPYAVLGLVNVRYTALTQADRRTYSREAQQARSTSAERYPVPSFFALPGDYHTMGSLRGTYVQPPPTVGYLTAATVGRER